MYISDLGKNWAKCTVEKSGGHGKMVFAYICACCTFLTSSKVIVYKSCGELYISIKI